MIAAGNSGANGNYTLSSPFPSSAQGEYDNGMISKGRKSGHDIIRMKGGGRRGGGIKRARWDWDFVGSRNEKASRAL